MGRRDLSTEVSKAVDENAILVRALTKIADARTNLHHKLIIKDCLVETIDDTLRWINMGMEYIGSDVRINAMGGDLGGQNFNQEQRLPDSWYDGRGSSEDSR